MSDDIQYEDRLRKLNGQLKSMARELPIDMQQRVPYELLSELAASLAQGQIFEIVNMLTEVQQATEKHLFQNRLQFLQKHRNEKQTYLNNAAKPSEMKLLEKKHKEQLKQFDMRLVTQIDQKVSDQQVTLERAGVPGFFVTNRPVDIQVQMYLLEFILRIGNSKVP